MSLNRPSDTEHKSVFRYLEARKPIHPDERTYILHKEDLVTLRPGREHAWLDRMIEAVLKRLYGPMPFLNVGHVALCVLITASTDIFI